MLQGPLGLQRLDKGSLRISKHISVASRSSFLLGVTALWVTFGSHRHRVRSFRNYRELKLYVVVESLTLFRLDLPFVQHKDRSALSCAAKYFVRRWPNRSEVHGSACCVARIRMLSVCCGSHEL